LRASTRSSAHTGTRARSPRRQWCLGPSQVCIPGVQRSRPSRGRTSFRKRRNLHGAYAGVLYWATMYLTHHYLIDVVGGACLATAFFYLFLSEDLRGAGSGVGAATGRRSKHEIYDLEAPRTGRRARGHITVDTDMSSDVSSPRNSDEQDITYRSPNPATTPHSGTAFITPAMPPQSKPLNKNAQPKKNSHRHTASIASLIRADERVEDGWSPIGGAGFVFPPTSLRGESGEGGVGERRPGIGRGDSS